MLKQLTQFDDNRTNATVVTPTCSSCCCCCYCLTTVASSSAIMAQRINKEATKNDVKGKISITILAALFLPAIGLITYGIYNLIHATSESCVSHETGYGGVYDTCTSNAERFLIPLLIVVPIAVLSYLYARVKMKYAFARAVGVTA